MENFFSKMTRQRIRRGVFPSVADLQAAIKAYLAEHNSQPQTLRLDQIRRDHSSQTRSLPCTICLSQCTLRSDNTSNKVSWETPFEAGV